MSEPAPDVARPAPTRPAVATRVGFAWGPGNWVQLCCAVAWGWIFLRPGRQPTAFDWWGSAAFPAAFAASAVQTAFAKGHPLRRRLAWLVWGLLAVATAYFVRELRRVS